MLDKTERVNKNIQEAKVIVNNLDDIFRYFDSLKEILPQIKSGEGEMEDDPEVADMLGSLGWADEGPTTVVQARRR
jgi:hypothetical protein